MTVEKSTYKTCKKTPSRQNGVLINIVLTFLVTLVKKSSELMLKGMGNQPHKSYVEVILRVKS